MTNKLFLIIFILCANINLKAQTDLNKKITELQIPTFPEGFDSYSLNQLKNKDVLGYFRDYINSKYNTKLKKDLFIQSQEYKELKDSLGKIMEGLKNKYFITTVKSEDTYNNSFISQFEQYNIEKKLKSVVIGISEVVQGTGNTHKESIFGSFFFPNIIYKTNTHNSVGTFRYNFQIKMIDIPMTVEEALKYDEKKLEVFVVYKFDDFIDKEYVKSNYSKIYVTYNKEIIYEIEFNKKNIAQTNALPFIGKKGIYFENTRTDYDFTIDKLGNCIIKETYPNSSKIIYKGKFKQKIQTKDIGFIIETEQVTVLDENGQVMNDCIDTNSENLDNKPCVFDFKNGLLK